MTSDAQALVPTPSSLDRCRSQIETLLGDIIRLGRFQLSFTFRRPEASGEAEAPEWVVDFSGPDADLLVEAHGELLSALEYVVLRAVRIEEGHQISFDCNGLRRLRLEELKLMAHVAADRVRETGSPFALAPMSARERRIVHLALHGRPEVRTESDGHGPDRKVVILPAPSVK